MQRQQQQWKCLAGFALALCCASAQAVPTVWIDHSAAEVLVGESFEIALRGQGFGQTSDGQVINNLSGGQKVTLRFDPDLFQLQQVALEAIWSFAAANKAGTIDNQTGELNGLAFGSFPALTNDEFAIATLSFKALKEGKGTIEATAGEFVGRVNNASGKLIPVQFQAAEIQVSAIPEPHVYGLMAVGLALIAGWRGVKRRTSLPPMRRRR